MYRPSLALYLLPSNKSPVTRRDLAFLSLQTQSVPSQNEMDTGGGNHHAAATEEFLRTEEINAVVSCSLPNPVSQIGTHHSFWYITY